MKASPRAALLLAAWLGVLALEAALADVTQGQTLAVAASTLAVAALFQPVRRRVQVAVDHRSDRARYEGERVVETFGDHVRDEVHLDRLRMTLLRAVDSTMHPALAAVWLREKARRS